MVTLTDEERRKFALWLRQAAESNRAIVRQMKVVMLGSPKMLEAMSSKQISEAIACEVVATLLESLESQTTGPIVARIEYGDCKECGCTVPMSEAARVEGRNIWECPQCGHPHRRDELANVRYTEKKQ